MGKWGFLLNTVYAGKPVFKFVSKKMSITFIFMSRENFEAFKVIIVQLETVVEILLKMWGSLILKVIFHIYKILIDFNCL